MRAIGHDLPVRLAKWIAALDCQRPVDIVMANGRFRHIADSSGSAPSGHFLESSGRSNLGPKQGRKWAFQQSNLKNAVFLGGKGESPEDRHGQRGLQRVTIAAYLWFRGGC